MNKQTDEKKPSEFENFRELAKNLMAVPKKEVDKKREAYESKKKREGERKK